MDAQTNGALIQGAQNGQPTPQFVETPICSLSSTLFWPR